MPDLLDFLKIFHKSWENCLSDPRLISFQTVPNIHVSFAISNLAESGWNVWCLLMFFGVSC